MGIPGSPSGETPPSRYFKDAHHLRGYAWTPTDFFLRTTQNAQVSLGCLRRAADAMRYFDACEPRTIADC